MKTVKKVLISICCVMMLFSGIAVSAAEAPPKAEKPAWHDVWDIQDYVSDQVYNLNMAGKLDFYGTESDREEMSSHSKPGLLIANAEKEQEFARYNDEVYGQSGEVEPDDLLQGIFLESYSGFYDAAMALVNSVEKASGTYYTDGLWPKWDEFADLNDLFWRKVENGSILVIMDGEEAPEGVEWVYLSAMKKYDETSLAIWERTDVWTYREATREEVLTEISNFKAAFEELYKGGEFTLDLSQPAPDTDISTDTCTDTCTDEDSLSTSFTDDNNDTTEKVPEMWKPTTPDEIKRYECRGKETIQVTQANGNAYPVKMVNIMQGPKCFASFEAVLGDYTIGRTYDIYPDGNKVYDMEQKVELTIKIPEAVYSANREYKMICVTKDGKPIVYDDLDKNPETITFRTNTFYAYALIYK